MTYKQKIIRQLVRICQDSHPYSEFSDKCGRVLEKVWERACNEQQKIDNNILAENWKCSSKLKDIKPKL